MSHIHKIAVAFSQRNDWSFVKLFRNTELITAGLSVTVGRGLLKCDLLTICDFFKGASCRLTLSRVTFVTTPSTIHHPTADFFRIRRKKKKAVS
jgi:hypothetical protein